MERKRVILFRIIRLKMRIPITKEEMRRKEKKERKRMKKEADTDIEQ